MTYGNLDHLTRITTVKSLLSTSLNSSLMCSNFRIVQHDLQVYDTSTSKTVLRRLKVNAGAGWLQWHPSAATTIKTMAHESCVLDAIVNKWFFTT